MPNQGKKILVADDDFEQRDLYYDLFKEHGYYVVTADDGLEALEKSLQMKPDLVFTGIIMPRMDGFELIRNLRNNISTASTPVIMFSHLGREEDRKKTKALFKVDFMVKGIDSPREILARVEELLLNQSKSQQRPDAVGRRWSDRNPTIIKEIKTPDFAKAF